MFPSEHTRPVDPPRPRAALAVLVIALLIAAVSIIRTIPATDATDLIAAAALDAGDPADVAPIGPQDLPHAGLLPERTDVMRAAIEAASVGPAGSMAAPPPGAFGADPAPCAERDRILPRDLSPVTYRPASAGCLVASGVLDDPYLGRSMPYTDAQAERVGIDRIVPLAYAWRHGADAWTPARRQAFARDPLNLVAVDARSIRHKDDRGPGDWLPPNVNLRCAYAARFAAVATAYGLTITPADQAVARRQCATPP